MAILLIGLNLSELKVDQEMDNLAMGKTAMVVGVKLSGEKDSEEGIIELERLLDTLGVRVLGRVLQKRDRLHPKSIVGTGKLEEIKRAAESDGVEMLVFDRPLSGPQVRNIEAVTCLATFDRTAIILEIFSRKRFCSA